MMGLLERQIETTLTLQRGEEALSKAIDHLVIRYGELDPEGPVGLRRYLSSMVDTAKQIGSLNEFHQTHLKDG